jgi:hypothetical protein
VAYIVRAICTADVVPTIGSILKWLKEEGGFPEADAPGEGPKALGSLKWKSFELVYDANKESLLVECNRNTGPRSLCAREVQGELESLDGVKQSRAKQRVKAHLEKARFVVCCTVSGDDDHGEAPTVRSVLDFFVDHCGAILDTEDEGFYSRSDAPLLGRNAGNV